MAAAIVAGAARPAHAQAAGSDVDRRRGAFQAEVERGGLLAADHFDVDVVRGPDGKMRPGRVVYVGSARYESDGGKIILFADGIVAWGPPGKGANPVQATELYAEGDVYLLAFGDTFQADWLYLDLATGEGRLSRATLRSAGDLTRRSPLLVRAERARVGDELTSFSGEVVELSTCDYHEPHFALTARSVSVRTRDPGAIAREEEGERPEARLEIERPAVETYGVPIFLFPWSLSWDTSWNRFLPRATVGKSGRFGHFLLSELPVYPGRELDLFAKLDVMEKRGLGTGAAASWRGPERDRESYVGFFDAYYVSDRGDEDNSTGLPPPERDRFRLRAFHRDDLPWGFRREGELSWISDRAFLPEFYKAEAQTGKEQETVAYLRWLNPAVPNMGGTLLGRWRLNDFQTQAESLPRGRFSWIGEPFLDSVLPGGRGVYLTSALELANARTRFDEDLLLPSSRVLRTDLENRLDYPIPLGPIQVDPFASARYSAWDQRLVAGTPGDPFGAQRGGDGAIDRLAAAAGAIATTDLWRDFGGVRHIATPFVGYANAFYVDTAPEALVLIDAVETVRPQAFFPFGVRNRIQLWQEAVSGSADVLDWEVTARWYPRPTADNAGDRFGPVRSDLRVSPIAWMGGRWRSDWDPNPGGGLFRSDAEAWVRPDPALSVGAGYRLLEKTYETIEVGIDVRIPWAEKWGAFASTQYDLERDGFTRNRFALRRFFHRFVLEGTVDVDFNEFGADEGPDIRFAATFVPLELFGRSGPFGGGDVQRGVNPLF